VKAKIIRYLPYCRSSGKKSASKTCLGLKVQAEGKVFLGKLEPFYKNKTTGNLKCYSTAIRNISLRN